jgi:hypothetical protein
MRTQAGWMTAGFGADATALSWAASTVMIAFACFRRSQPNLSLPHSAVIALAVAGANTAT